MKYGNARTLHVLGEGLWLDNLTREMLNKGTVAHLARKNSNLCSIPYRTRCTRAGII
jgi:hypothetical protein